MLFTNDGNAAAAPTPVTAFPEVEMNSRRVIPISVLLLFWSVWSVWTVEVIARSDRCSGKLQYISELQYTPISKNIAGFDQVAMEFTTLHSQPCHGFA